MGTNCNVSFVFTNENCTVIHDKDDQRLMIYDSEGEFIDYYNLESRSPLEIEYLISEITTAAQAGAKALCLKLINDLECVCGLYDRADYDELIDVYGEEYVNRIGQYCLHILE